MSHTEIFVTGVLFGVVFILLVQLLVDIFFGDKP